MTSSEKRVAITGASGFVGSQLAERFERAGWPVVRFTRGAGQATDLTIPFHLGDDVDAEVFRSRHVSALVHCAYDFRPVRWDDIRRVNVEGSRRLIAATAAAGVPRTVVISTISAFVGCRSLYGRAKLEIEAEAARFGATVVRPGLVYGDLDSAGGGMIGSLRRSARGGLVPLIDGGRHHQYLVHIDDLFDLVRRLCAGDLIPPQRPVVVASPHGVTMRELVAGLARRQGTRPRFVSVPWRAVWLGLKGAETVGLRPSYRSDSVVSLVHQDPNPDFTSLGELGVSVREFGDELSRAG
ncbi:MAG: NAD-dependent epimerase/dehydratase family protein [Candidatus Dormiibacterota bacterium]